MHLRLRLLGIHYLGVSWSFPDLPCSPALLYLHLAFTLGLPTFRLPYLNHALFCLFPHLSGFEFTLNLPSPRLCLSLVMICLIICVNYLTLSCPALPSLDLALPTLIL